MQESRQEFISRNRAPRVHITYKPSVSEPEVEIPFVMGVLADLSGKPSEPLPTVKDRDFKEVDADTFEKFLKSTKPRAAFSVPNVLTDEGGNIGVELEFTKMDDFLPDAVAQNVKPLKHIFEARKRIDNLLTWIDGKDKAEALFEKLFARDEEGNLVNKSLIEALASQESPSDDADSDSGGSEEGGAAES
jgi:type VI secretion system protein ImpB